MTQKLGHNLSRLELIAEWDALVRRRWRIGKANACRRCSPVELPQEEKPLWETPVRHEPPKRLMRTCLSSLDDSETFGKLMATEAQSKGFYQAPRRAFVADGPRCNWTLWKRHLPTFTAIVDLLRVVSYSYHAAVAIGGSEDFGCLILKKAQISDILT